MPVGQISADRADTVDPVLQKKVNQVVELTGRSKDDVIVALHDCDNDTNRAINMLLEGENDQGEWQESGKRRKNKAPPPAMDPPVPSKPDRPDKSRDRDDRHEGPPPRRGRQPPRLARKNREYEENERNRTDSGSRERGFGEGRRGGRGRGGMTGSGRGRGRGGRRGGGPDRGSRYDREGSNGPSIGTWAGEAAEKDPNDFSVSTWTDDMTEDWGNDEWTGSLEETKVFTKSENNFNDAPKSYGSVGDSESSVFTAPVEREPETFSSFAAFSNAATNGSALGDVTSALHGSTSLGSDPLANSLGLTPSSLSAGTGSLGQASTLGQRLDIGMLLKSAEAEAAAQAQQQSQFISQFTKPAVDSTSRNNSVGIGGSVSLSDERLGSSLAEMADRVPPVSLHTHQTSQNSAFSQQNTISQSISQSIAPTQSIGQAISQALTQSISPPSQPQPPVTALSQQQRPKVQRSKLPPPSKIPQNAVEMPGHLGQFNLDVQFGNWGDASTTASSGVGFGFGIDSAESSTAYTTSVSSAPSTTAISNHLPVGSHTLLDDVSTGSSLQSNTISSASAGAVSVSSAPVPDTRPVTPPQPAVSAVPAGYPSPSPAKAPAANDSYQPSTPHQNSIPSATQGSPQSPPEPIPFPSSQERKTSPHYGQRSTSSTGPLSSKSSGTSMPFNQSPYSSNYQSAYNASKPTGLNGSAYPSHTAPSGQGSQHLSNSAGSGVSNSSSGSYGSSAYQSYHQPGSYTANQTNPNTGSLYQGSSAPAAGSISYSSQSNSSSAPAPGAYQNPSTGGASSSASFPSQSNSYQNQSQSNYHSSRDTVVTNAYTAPVSSYSSSSNYQSNVNGGQNQPNAFQAAVSQAAAANTGYSTASSPYQRDTSSSGQTASSPYQRDTSSSGQSSYNASQTYGGSGSHQNSLPLSSNKLSDSLQKMNVKDTNSLDASLKQGSSQYESSAVSTAAPLSTPSCTAPLSTPSSASVSAALGLTSNTTTTSATAVSMATGNTKSSLPLTSKAPPNLPPGVPPLMSSYMIGQPAGLPFAFPGLPQQQLYSFEDLQLLQSRLPPMPPSTLPATRDGLASVPYTGTDGSKLGRLDAQSPVQTNTSQQQAQAQSQSAHQQYISPGLPHYNYYAYPSVIPGGYSAYPPMYPAAVGNIVPPVTAHASTTANTQFQKPAGYGSHGYGAATYDDLSNQTQDFSKSYGASPSASKVSAAGAAVTSSGSDLSGSAYGKSHAQSFDKVGFAAGTPPPFANLQALSSGSQAAGLPQAAAAAYGVPYMPAMAHQPHSQMMQAHHMPQESGASSRVTGQTGQGKPVGGVSKGYSTGGYWGN